MDRVTEILQDPEKMRQISEIAAAMDIPSDSENASTANLFSKPMIQHFSEIIRQTEEKGKKQQSLIHALMPYLNPSRRIKLERAMQISQISRLAGAALQHNERMSGHV